MQTWWLPRVSPSITHRGRDDACKSYVQLLTDKQKNPERLNAPSSHKTVRASRMVGSGGFVGHQQLRVPLGVPGANFWIAFTGDNVRMQDMSCSVFWKLRQINGVLCGQLSFN